MRVLTIILCNLLVINSYSQLAKYVFGSPAPLPADKTAINRLAEDYYKETWQFPSEEIIGVSKPEYNVFGATRSSGIPRTIINVEPPGIVEMKVLNDNNLLIVSPKEFRWNNQPFNMNIYKNCNIYIPSIVDIIMLNNETGSVIWNTTINASGVFEIFENNNLIFVKSIDFHESGVVSDQKVTILDKSSGENIWETGGKRHLEIDIFPENSLVTITLAEDDKQGKGILQVYSFHNEPLLEQHVSNIDINFKPLLHLENLIYVCDNILHLNNLKSPAISWKYEVDSTLLWSAIFMDKACLYLPFKNRITALAMEDGEPDWTYQQDTQNIDRLQCENDNLYVVEMLSEPIELDKKTIRSSFKKITPQKFTSSKFKKNVLYQIDIPTLSRFFTVTSINLSGTKNWTFSGEGGPVYSVKLKEDALYFSTQENLFAISNIDGKLIQKAVLDNPDELSLNDILFLDNKIIVRNEKYVYCFDYKNLQLLYKHEFDLVWPTISTTDITKDLIAGNWIMSYVVSPGGKDLHTAYMTDANMLFVRHSQAVSASRSASINNTLTARQRQDIAINHLAADMGMLVGVYQTAVATNIRCWIDTYHAQLMCQPFLWHEANNITRHDNNDVTVRIVNKTIDKQKFIALEVVELNTGIVKSQVLSPFQFREYFKTWYRNPNQTWAFTGYVPVLNLKDHALRTVIDWKTLSIYHYGPGLNVDTYQYYDEKNFSRGKLIRVPFRFNTEKKYL